MSILAQIKADQLNARKEKRTTIAALLTTLIGEAAVIGKNAGNRESTDQEVMAVIKKFVKNIDEMLPLLQGTIAPGNESVLAYDKALLERNYLMTYLPTQLTDVQLTVIITDLIKSGHVGSNVGAIMKVLKSTYDGQYDGKTASNVIKDVIAQLAAIDV